MTKLRLVEPSTITEWRSEISRIGAGVNDPDLYRRIQKACLQKQAFLFVSRDGFVVLKPVAGPGVLIWVAHSIRPTDKLAYIFELEQFARDISAKLLTFWSSRKGFSRIIPRFGFSSRPAEWMGKPITVWTKFL